MPVRVAVGVFKNNQVAQSSAIAVGNSILQNRHQSKENRGMVAIGDGIHLQPAYRVVNDDRDVVDAFSMDGPNLTNIKQS